VALFPFVGPIIYMVLRPPEYLEDVRERDLELANAEARAQQFHRLLCPYCSYRVERDFVRCPSCLRKLKERCANCSRPLDQAWTICPYCEADVPGVSTPRVRRRRGSGLDGEIAEYERPLAPEGEPEAALTASEPSQTAAELRSERRATDRRAASTARAAAATRRPRPAP
jgi:RNA polymerase subunit RPABC4/transcription elongation factor Spt4